MRTERAQKKVAAGLDRIVGELGSSGYLAGSRFTVADLTAAALLFPLARPAELQYDYPRAATLAADRVARRASGS